MARIDYKSNAKYFRQISYKPGVILIVVGALMLVTGSAGPIILGLLLAGAGAYLIYRQVADRPSDEDIESQISSIHSELYKRALKALGLDEEEVKLIDPIVLSGYYFDPLGAGWQAKKGKDGNFRSSNYEGVAIFFAEQELHSYKYQLSLTTENDSREETDVYFYRDVVSVATASRSIPVPVLGEKTRQVVNQEEFRLTTSGGTVIKCSVNTSGDSLSRDIQGARHLIRNKKMHAV
jgi:hypothetical protein